MRVLVSGGNGMIGSALIAHLRAALHDVRKLNRKPGQDIFWNPETGELDEKALEKWGCPEAVVHLAGENVASHRWSEDQKRRIRDSRVAATEKLCRSLRTPIFIGASAVGYYGDRGDEILTEESTPGHDFLARVCVGWENATKPLQNSGTRVAHLRFGMVLSREGGALATMLPLFRLGLGGPLGSGRQWVSWIALGDIVRMIEFALRESAMSGAYNAVAPSPVTNREFARELGAALHRPAILPVPAFALRLALGEMADVILSSQRAVPARLESLGFAFAYLTLEKAMTTISETGNR